MELLQTCGIKSALFFKKKFCKYIKNDGVGQVRACLYGATFAHVFLMYYDYLLTVPPVSRYQPRSGSKGQATLCVHTKCAIRTLHPILLRSLKKCSADREYMF